jgi:hypothetical protein
MGILEKYACPFLCNIEVSQISKKGFLLMLRKCFMDALSLGLRRSKMRWPGHRKIRYQETLVCAWTVELE